MEISEYDEVIIKPSKRERKYLIKLESEKKIKLQFLRNNRVRIKIGSNVGFINLTDHQIRIRPKIKYLSLFYMIARSQGLSNVYVYRRLPPSWFDSTKESHEFLVQLFIFILQDFLEFGLRRGYRERIESLQRPKGKILVLQNIKAPPWKREKLICAFDEFSFDIFINQILHHTVFILLQTAVQPHLRNTLNKMTRKLNDISLLKKITLDEIDQFELTKNYAHYESVLSYCRIIIGNLSLSSDHGKSSLNSFLINMNSLYENYIFSMMRKFFHDFKVLKKQVNVIGNRGKEQRIIITQPDIQIREKDKPDPIYLVADAKYKFVDMKSDKLSIQSDFYQILSYSLLTKSKKALLIYPQYQDENTEGVKFQMEDYKIEIMIIPLPLKGDTWDQIDNQVMKSLGKIRDWIEIY